MKLSKSGLALGAAVAAATGLIGGAAAAAVSVHRWRRQPDPATGEDFREPPGTIHGIVPASDGGEIHVLDRGHGRPFFLIHGVTASSLVWHYQLIDLVDSGYRVVAMDMRGHGKSKAGRAGFALEAMADDLLQVIGALDLHDAVAVGHSMGAMLLLKLLADQPELVQTGAISSIALVATSASPVLGNGVPLAAAELVRVLTPAAGKGHILATGGRLGRTRPPGDLAAAYTRLAFGSHPWPTHVELLRAMTSAIPADVVGQLVQTLLSLDVRPHLPKIAAPTLVVVGTRDLLTPLRHARYLANHIPVAELQILPSCGHMVMFERREELARLLIDFAHRTEPVADAEPAQVASLPDQ